MCIVCKALCGRPLPLYYRHDPDLFHPELCTRIVNDFIRSCRATPNPLGKDLLVSVFYPIGSNPLSFFRSSISLIISECFTQYLFRSNRIRMLRGRFPTRRRRVAGRSPRGLYTPRPSSSLASPLPRHVFQRGIRRIPRRGCPLPSRRHDFDHRENLTPRRPLTAASPLDNFSRDLLNSLPVVDIVDIKSKLNADPGDPYVMLGQYLNTFPYLDYFSARHLSIITSFQQFSSINPPAFVNDKKGLIYLSFQINRYPLTFFKYRFC